MNKTFIIIQREFATRIKKKSFILLTILMPFIFAALIFLPLWLATIKSDEQKTVMVIDKTEQYAECFKDNASYHFEIAEKNEDKFYEEDSDVEAVIVIKSDLRVNPKDIAIYSRREVPADLLNIAGSALNEKIRKDKLAAYDVPGLDGIINDVQEDIVIPTVKRDEVGTETSSNTYIAMIAGFLTTFMIYMFVMTYGSMVMQSVMEEKTNRIVELMISSVKPFQLMMGKIVGCALVGFVQMIIWGIMLAIILGVCATMFGMQAQPTPDTTMAMMTGPTPQLPMSETEAMVSALMNLPYLEMSVMFVIYFIGGYLLYASFFAAVGASVNEQEDSSQFVMPVIIIMVFGLYAAMYSAENTNGPLAFWASMFPLTSPIVMMVRIPFDVPLWQELLSIAILFGTSVLFVWLSGKIYRVGILMYGKKPSVKEMIKWIKYK